MTGLPSDDAVLRSVVAGDGGDPRPRRRRDDRLRGGQGAAGAAGGRRDGVLERRGRRIEGARGPASASSGVDDFGAPAYPELVLAVTRTELEDRRPEVNAIVGALQRGYTEALVDPESAVQAMLSREEGLDRKTLSAQSRRSSRRSRPACPPSGYLDRARLRAWARWDARVRHPHEPPDVARAFDTTLVGPASRD